MSADAAKSPVGDELLAKLRKTIIHEFPVTSESLAENYQKLFEEIINPQEFDCQSLDLFVYRVELEHGIWKTKFRDRHLIINPTKVSEVVSLSPCLYTMFQDTILRMTNLEEKDLASPKADKLPEDALLEAQLPPLSQKGIVVRSLVLSDPLSG